MLSKLKIIGYVVASAMAISCRKDVGKIPAENPPSECQEVSAPQGGWNVKVEGKRTIKPIGVTEQYVLFLSLDTSNHTYQLIKWDRFSNSVKQIAANVMGDFDAVGEWVVFCTSKFQLYKVKLNGDSLLQLNPEETFLFPAWHNTGKFFYCVNNVRPESYQIRQTGEIIDTLPFSSKIYSRDSFMLFSRIHGDLQQLIKKNTVTKTEVILTEIALSDPADLTIHGFFFGVTCNDIYFYSKAGLWKLDTHSSTRKLVIANCQDLFYTDFSFDQNSGRFFATLIERKIKSAVDLSVSYSLVELKYNTAPFKLKLPALP